MVKRNESKVMISGAVIAATIETMETLGHIGETVLRDQGITTIDPDSEYSYELRSAIHKAAYDRFGEIALVSFGFNHAEKYESSFLKEIANISKNNEGLLRSDNLDENYIGF